MAATPDDLLLEYLDRKDRGDPIAFDAFCGEHPGQALALRTLFRGWELAHHRFASRGASLAERTRAMHLSSVEPTVTLDADADAEPPGSTDPNLLEALKSRGPSSARYSPKDAIAQGGMGLIFRVWDADLRRHLAMKVMLDEKAGEPSRLSRFLEEAQITGQLEHPGIVPVHELGIDASGRVFFTMKLVKGITLAEVLDAVASGAEDWNRTRALSVVLRVCEAMAFAHDKGVIHRDLKPANVMVGKFGETYVMDWGLARVLGRADAKDLRIRPDASVSVRTERQAEKGALPDSRIYTMDGDVVGTPAYMPPEQAMGDLDRVGPASDVYAVGAILYHLLTGRMPYVAPGEHPPGRVIVEMVRHAPPAPVHSLTKDVPAELEAICDKAMARKIEDRYATMVDLARDLRAFLEQRVVSAYETGAIAEIRKWVVRNKALASAAAALVLVLAGAIVVVSKKNVALAGANTEITAQKNEVTARKAEFDQLKGVVLLDDATKAEADLYPAWPEKIPAMERWLANDARKLEDLKPVLAKTLADLEARALPRTDAERNGDRTTRPDFAKLEALRVRVGATKRAQAVRAGLAHAETVALTADLAAKSALELNDFAWKRVDPDASKRQFGEEVLALAAARAAVAKIEAGDKTAELASTLDTLAWALLANGLDVEAKAAGARALENAPEDKKKDYEGYRTNLETAIAAATGPGAAKALADAETEVNRIETAVNARRSWRFEKEEDRFLHDTLEKLSSDIAAFEAGAKKGVEQRLAWAQKIGDLTLHHRNARVTWDDARAALAKADGVVASTLYKESPIDLKPQAGLVPIGMNPVTKLWEFYELRSACDLEAGQDPAAVEIPSFKEDGSIEVKDGTGIVFVLIPGGTFWQGAQKQDTSGPNFDPGAEDDETPQQVTLAPYFLARHEMTKAQWKRLTGGDEPSWYQRGSTYDNDPLPIGWRHPVEQVSWTDSDLWMRHAGLSVPTEAQWERGARGGSSTPWWTGADASSLAGTANVLDKSAEAKYPGWGRQIGDFDDGFIDISPVGRYRANSFGLFDVHGNVWEWCADVSATPFSTPRAGDGLRESRHNGTALRVDRGGSNADSAPGARSAYRGRAAPSIRNFHLGLRPARVLH